MYERTIVILHVTISLETHCIKWHVWTTSVFNGVV